MVHAKRDEKRWEDSTLEPIAIVGMSCHLPGQVRSPSALWDLLKAKGSVQTPKVPENRFNIDAHYHTDLERPGSFNVLGGYFLDGALEDFDPTFFNITPIEAMWMDPQQRKILEVAYECLESGGLTLDSVAGSNTAVFIGSFTSDYQQMSIRDTDFRHNYAATGVDPGIISNRIGNVFNLRGPSFTINTACSSSVYAIHNACHALRARDCDAALAGGVNLIMTVDQHMNTAKLGILSPTSTCHTFDASADGYGRAEGAGALYLKRLNEAIRDGDPIRGVIRSSFVNTNGKVDGMGITHPSVEGQGRVLRMAYARANLDPNKTAYAECHGTGTPVGDPIEVRAIATAMNDTRSLDKPLLVGAVKANIGHSEAASGIFAVMKGALMTEKAVIPGVAGFKKLNPEILEKDWNVKVNTETTPWPSDFAVRRASVSSFGYGGTNGHVIVEAVESLYPWYQHGKAKSEAAYDHSASRPFLVTLSAHDKATLTRNIDAHAQVADQFYLADLAHTLNTKRTKFSTQAYTVAYENKVAEAFDSAAFKVGTASGKPEVGYIFTGQGAQWVGVAVEALQHFPAFLKTIRDLDAILQRLDPAPAWKLEDVLRAPKESSRLSEAEIAQPICTAIQIAVVDLLNDWDVAPTVTVGHSSGEIGAAYAAGLISAPEAIIAAFYRGFAVKEVAPVGSMLAVGLGVEDIAKYLPGFPADVVVACENSPNSVTLSGTPAGIAAAKETLDADRVFARELRTGKAYHSQHMKDVAPLYESLLALSYQKIDEEDLAWRLPRSRMISSVTGEEIQGDHIPSTYWSKNLLNRVLFDTAIRTLGNLEDLNDVSVMVEVGPHSALAGPFKQICAANNFSRFRYIPTLVRHADSAVELLKTAGDLALNNYNVDLQAVNETDDTRSGSSFQKKRKPLTLVDLPPYQWNYERRFWAEPRFSTEQRYIKYPRHDLLGTRVVGLSGSSPVWKNQLRHRDVPWLKDHSLGNSAIFPAAGHFSMAIEALRQLSEEEGVQIESTTLRDIAIKTALVIPETDNGVETQFRMQKVDKAESGNSTAWYTFAVESITDGVWTTHTQGHIAGNYTPRPEKIESPITVSKLTQRVPGKRWYDAFHRVGFQYAGSFQPLKRIRANGKDRQAAATLNVTAESGLMKDESRYLLHPATIDACLQLIIISINHGLHKEMPWGVVPLDLEEVTLWTAGDDIGSEGHAVAWTDHRDGRYFNTNTKLETKSGRVVLDVKNLTCVAYEAAVPQSASEDRAPEPYMKVVWQPDASGQSEHQTSLKHSEKPLTILSLEPEASPVQELAGSLGSGGLPVATASIASFNDVAGNILIHDTAGTLLFAATQNVAVFDALKKVLSSGAPIVWLTSGVNQGAYNFGSMNQGFLRAIRSEQAAAKITLLDVDEETSTTAVSEVLADLLDSVSTKDSGVDTEYWLNNGTLTVPRIIPNDLLNSQYAAKNIAIQESVLSNQERLAGSFRDGELIFQRADQADLFANEVEIQVEAFDFHHSKKPTHFAVGKVAKGGPLELEGKTVIAYSEDAFSTCTKVSTRDIVELPADFKKEDILSSLAPLSSALNALSLVGKAQSGDRVILLKPSNAFIRAATTLSPIIGFELTVAQQLDEIRSLLTSSVASPTIAVADEWSALAQDVWRLLPAGGRFILNDGTITQALDTAPLAKGVPFAVTGLETVHKQQSNAATSISQIIKATLEIVNTNPALQQTAIVYDIGSVKNPQGEDGAVVALNYGQSKIKFQPSVKEMSFSSDAAYVLVGCLGGLGRSLTTFMRERGCSNFVFISRSGADKADAAQVVNELTASGTNALVYRGDAANGEDVGRIIADVRKSYTIKGVVHAAMVLKDGMFEGLSHENFKAAIDPKVLGALTLHEVLKDDPLDFFVMTSSISAVLGNPGQTNYSAANSFLDALAFYRNKHGLPGTSLALPMVLDVGVVSENEDIELSLLRKGMYGIDEREMLKSFEVAMLQPVPAEATIGDAQIVLGLDPTLLAAAVSSEGAVDPYWYNDARLSSIRAVVEEIVKTSSSTGKTKGDFVSTLASVAAEGQGALVSAISQHLIQKCSSILMLNAEDFELDGRSIASYGLDSMIGAEFRNWLFKEFAFEIGFQTLLTPAMTFKVLATEITEKLGLV